MSDPRSILLLCRTTRAEAGNVAEHIRALSTQSRHRVYAFNPVDRPDAAALLDLDEFDAVVVHYTLAITIERYLPAVLRAKLTAYRNLKILFVQDEYRWIDAIAARIRELGIDVLFTCVPEREWPNVYGLRIPSVRLVPTLPGYVPDQLVGRPTPPVSERPIDVGYRGRTVPLWLGRLGHEKKAIGVGFAERAGAFGLRCDISSSERDRIYGEDWIRFLRSCKATLGTESGASIADFDGSIAARVRDYLVRHPAAAFDELEREVLGPHEGNVVINTVSSRMFEAAALRTAMILFPGEYSGAVEPWRHYIPLEKDFSNMGEVAERLRDDAFLEGLTERAYADLVASGRYSLRRFVAEFDEFVAGESEVRSPAGKPAYRRAQLRRRFAARQALAPVRRAAGRALQPLAMAGLTARDPELRALARDGRPSAALAGDLWRLAALRRAVHRGLFVAVPSLEEDGRRLVLSSRAVGERRGAASAEAVERALEAGSVEQLIWDHSALGDAVPLLGAGLIPTRVGEHGVPGAHAFTALAELAQRAPRPVVRALGPLLRDGSGPSAS